VYVAAVSAATHAARTFLRIITVGCATEQKKSMDHRTSSGWHGCTITLLPRVTDVDCVASDTATSSAAVSASLSENKMAAPPTASTSAWCLKYRS
jgi:hypothetical protein